MSVNDKQARLNHANELIKIISSHGRRFFWRAGCQVRDKETNTISFVPDERLARLELRKGRVYLIDDYTGKAVYTHPTPFGNEWTGFSHGGTLRALVEDMRDYIVKGTPIPRWKIVIQRLGAESLEGNIWGYDQAAAQAVRDAAYALPIVAAA